MISTVVGLNWGDEGKGRMVDYLAADADIVGRYHGGSNAGHTIQLDEGRFTLHSLPSSVFRPGVRNVLGPGMTVDLDGLLAEIDLVTRHGVDPSGILLSGNASICFPFHRDLDAHEETRLGRNQYGSTKMGISPAYGDRVMKKTLLVRELFETRQLASRLSAVVEWANVRLEKIYGEPGWDLRDAERWAADVRERIEPYLSDTTAVLTQAEQADASVLAEGQLGALRDIYFGIYPLSTSSICLAAHAPVGLGVPWARVRHTVGVTKAFSSCVGAGPFVTEFDDERAAFLRDRWGEFGATTNRPRRLGHFDAVATCYGVVMQGADEVAVTNLDQLSGTGELKICTGYRIDGRVTPDFTPSVAALSEAEPCYETFAGWDADITGIRTYDNLPKQARAYLEAIEALLRVPVTYVSVGAHRDALVIR
ncbi:adenylosuccinate synthase [Micromonospora sp. HNM0581]|uniref:adenylosuccinate synthase n=1 Tax=Micromonospora sp. HNM0581 TaxID=2716341 RepID=UPI00146B1992|nr:adenylosuccinate synthase [Micromonospora sp. HNM0581]NLU77964.1 adenylosuccinate synthase [Micromonospora sp. HNM0581]